LTVEVAKASVETKGQIKPKADFRAIDSPKKLMNKFFLFLFCFQIKFVCSFLGRIYKASILLSVLTDL
jgi:hypothetical protein